MSQILQAWQALHCPTEYTSECGTGIIDISLEFEIADSYGIILWQLDLC